MEGSYPFKTGLVIYSSYPEVRSDPDLLLQRLALVARDTTWDAVEVQYVADTSYWPKIQRIIQDAGMDVIACAGPACVRLGWDLSSLDPAIRKAAVTGMQLAIDLAYSIGSRALVYMSGKDPGNGRKEEALNALRTSLAALSDYACQHAVDYRLVLTLEPADRDVQLKRLIGPTADAVAAVAEAREQGMLTDVTLDMSHVALLGETFEEAAGLLGGMVTHAHVANTLVCDPSRPEYGDQHPRFGLPGSEFGLPDITRFLDTVQSRCFSKAGPFPYGKPVVSLEVRPSADADPDILLSGAKRAFFSGLAGSTLQRGD